MSENAGNLADASSKLFADLSAQMGNQPVGAESFQQAWSQVRELGLPQVLIPEALGGMGGDWEDACAIARAAGRYALPLPIADAMLAELWLASGAPGRISSALPTVALCQNGRLWRESGQLLLTGKLEGASWGRWASDIVVMVPYESGTATVAIEPDASVAKTEDRNLAGEPRDTFAVNSLPTALLSTCQVPNQLLFEQAALLRTAQIAGALESALNLTVEYAKARKQFGRAIGQFQAVQQNIAIFAGEVAAVTCSSRSAAIAATHLGTDARFAIGCAKLRANAAIGIATAIAHQVHAAIGFTNEYSLHRFTRRLWAWRSEFGNDHYWSDQLGSAVCNRGADHFWPDLTALDDRASAHS